MHLTAQPPSLTVPLTDVIEAVELTHPDSPKDRIGQRTRYTSLAIINFTLMIFVAIVLLFLSACGGGSGTEPGSDGNNAANDPSNPPADDTETGDSAPDSPEDMPIPADTDTSQSGSDDIPESLGTINTSNMGALYNHITGVINLEPFETFLDLGETIVSNPIGVQLDDFQIVRVESNGRVWDCVDGTCIDLPDFTENPDTSVEIEYTCSNGGTVAAGFSRVTTRQEFTFDYANCGLQSGLSVSGISSIELTAVESNLGPRQLYRFRNVELASTGNNTETLTGQLSWIGSDRDPNRLAGYLSLTAIPSEPFFYSKRSDAGETTIEDLSIWRTVGETLNNLNGLDDWEQTLRATFVVQSEETDLQPVLVSTPEELSTPSADACFATGSMKLAANDNSELLISATGVEDQISLQVTDSSGSVASTIMEPWITADRPVPPKQLDYLLDTASTMEGDSCAPFKLESNRP